MNQSHLISCGLEGRTAFIEVANPPVNALGFSLRSQLHLELQRLLSARDIDAIVLTGAGRFFMSGADISELDHPVEPPGLLEIEAVIRALRVPVIAAMHGPVLGGGFLLGLMCDYRVARVDATFGFPEVRLGLLPTFGGTQILPRLVGVDRASDLIVSGTTLSARQAHALGIVDQISELAPVSAGGALVMRGPLPKRRLLDQPWPPGEEGRRALGVRRTVSLAESPLFQAPIAALDALKAGFDLPPEGALMEEGRLFEQLRTSAQSRTLRRLFFAERKGARGPWSDPAVTAATGKFRLRHGHDGEPESEECVDLVQPGLMAKNRAVEIIRTSGAPDAHVAGAIASAKAAGLTCFVSSGRSASSALFHAARGAIADLVRAHGAQATGFSLRHHGVDADALTPVVGSITAVGEYDEKIPDALRQALRVEGEHLMRQSVLGSGDIADALCVAATGWPRYHADIFA